MELWSEYEGRSIDGQFPLERLIRPEGRSAFFSTTTSGRSTVIRLIESHFDEDEILARWTGVSDLHQPNLLTLTRFGQAMMDETSLVYVVLEPTEADLSQILCERSLTLAETRQVAGSLIPAVQALHAKGFLHEHIQSANVLAVGEVVKLRSDCIREAPDGAQGMTLRLRDVHDLAVLLLECLTQQRTSSTGPAGPPLSASFREIIQNGISGAWGLAQMAAALEAEEGSASATDRSAAVPPDTPTTLRELHRNAVPSGVSTVAPKPAFREVAAARSEPSFPQSSPGRVQLPVLEQPSRSRRLLLSLLAAVICLMLFGVYKVLHSRGETTAVQTPVPEIGARNADLPAVAKTPAPSPALVVSAHPRASAVRESWRVVAYTYNRQDQATAKVRKLEQGYASFQPAVFSPTGRAPFLVTLGGPLSRESAFALRDKLRHMGLPRDLYAQNYSGKAR